MATFGQKLRGRKTKNLTLSRCAFGLVARPTERISGWRGKAKTTENGSGKRGRTGTPEHALRCFLLGINRGNRLSLISLISLIVSILEISSGASKVWVVKIFLHELFQFWRRNKKITCWNIQYFSKRIEFRDESMVLFWSLVVHNAVGARRARALQQFAEKKLFCCVLPLIVCVCVYTRTPLSFPLSATRCPIQSNRQITRVNNNIYPENAILRPLLSSPEKNSDLFFCT